MTEDYKNLLHYIDALGQHEVNRLTEYQFVNMVDAAGILYEAGQYGPPESPDANPQSSPLHDIRFTLIGEDGRERRVLTTFSFAGTLMRYSIS